MSETCLYISLVKLTALAPPRSTISNPQTSDEAKQHARDMLKKLDPENADYGKEHEQKPDLEGKNPGNVAGGLKA